MVVVVVVGGGGGGGGGLILCELSRKHDIMCPNRARNWSDACHIRAISGMYLHAMVCLLGIFFSTVSSYVPV